jgi:phenol 2-monooxygenase
MKNFSGKCFCHHSCFLKKMKIFFVLSPPGRAFQAFGEFTSGIGVHYAESPITNTRYQSHARNLIIGQRMLPQIVLRAADMRPDELQDLLTANTRFKLFIFTGNTSDPGQCERVARLAEEFGHPEGFLVRRPMAFDIVTILSARKEVVDYTALPLLLRPHWSACVSFPWLPFLGFRRLKCGF